VKKENTMRYLKYPKTLFSSLLGLMFCLSIAYAAESLSNDVRGWLPTKRLIDHGNPAKLRVQMLPSSSRRLGEIMQIQITSPEVGYLFLLDINSAGELTRIFPNQYTEQRMEKGFIKAGQTVIIPDENYGFDFKAIKPIGKGLLVAFLIEEEFVDGVVLSKEFESLNRTQTHATLEQLNHYLNEMLETDESIGRSVRWSIATLDYEILD
jgi:hypothetical protein